MDILTIDYQDSNAGIELVKSFHHTGFAVIKNHPINYKLVDDIFAEWQIFFNTKNKFNYPYNKKTGEGYVGMDLSEVAKGESVPDIKEFFHIYMPNGVYPQELTDSTKIYFDEIYNLANKLITWLDIYTPSEVRGLFSENLSSMLSFDKSLLRILHYPPFTGVEQRGALRAAAHEDINLITLLPASNQMGLQVQTKNNDWVDVGTNKGEMIINVGDMLQECSKHYYISTTHRVVNPRFEQFHKSRFSMPLFAHPREDVFLSDKYPKADIYLTERLTELGLVEA